MVYTPAQKHVIDCVLSIFETGRIPTAASYSTCSILADGAGISYGKHQCTDKAGSLDLVVAKYIAKGGQYAGALSVFMAHLKANDSSKVAPRGPYPDWLQALISTLKLAGSDVLMRQAQDEVFDEVYFKPAVRIATEIGLTKALSLLVIYDTCIHSGPGGVTNIRNRFAEPSPARGGSETKWIRSYLLARRAWLANSSNPLVQKTVYRMDSLGEIVAAGNWDLNTPIKIRGVTIL